MAKRPQYGILSGAKEKYFQSTSSVDRAAIFSRFRTFKLLGTAGTVAQCDGFIFHCRAAVKLFPCSPQKKKKKKRVDEMELAKKKEDEDDSSVCATEPVNRCSVSPSAVMQHMADNVQRRRTHPRSASQGD